MERKTWKTVLKGITAGIDYDTNSSTYQDPEQVLTYVEAHDNHTLWDKIELTNQVTVKKCENKCINYLLRFY